MAFEVKNLNFNYFGEKDCLHDISFECDKGQTVVIYGAQGSGKTSLLKAVTGVNQRNGGDVLIDGKKLEDIEIKNRNLSLILECNALFNHKSVYKNLIYSLKIRKTDKKEMEKKADLIGEVFNLSGIMGKKAYMLTDEEFTRTVLARMFIREADYYFIDNPLNNLTGDMRRELFYKMIQYFEKKNAGIIYATDDTAEAMILNKMTYILNFGYVIQKDYFVNIIKKPACLNVLKMLKDYFYNIINVSINEDAAECDFEVSGLYASVSNKDYNYTIGLPYSAVKEKTDGGIEAEITEIRCTGTGFLNKYRTIKGYEVFGAGEKLYSIGEKVRLDIDFKRCLFYDKDSEMLTDSIDLKSMTSKDESGKDNNKIVNSKL